LSFITVDQAKKLSADHVETVTTEQMEVIRTSILPAFNNAIEQWAEATNEPLHNGSSHLVVVTIPGSFDVDLGTKLLQKSLVSAGWNAKIDLPERPGIGETTLHIEVSFATPQPR